MMVMTDWKMTIKFTGRSAIGGLFRGVSWNKEGESEFVDHEGRGGEIIVIIVVGLYCILPVTCQAMF